MRAEIVSIGTELLLGSIIDTNAAYLAQRLATSGIDCFFVSEVGDNLGRLTATLRAAWERSDLVITTGGLGPTQDDLTREAIAALLGEEMRVVPLLEADLRANFAKRAAPMPATNLKQATLVASAQSIFNPVGTAPGWWVRRETETGTKQIISMPGVPFEMKRMWEREVEPRLQSESGFVIISRVLKVLGLGESAVEARVADLMLGANPTLAPYAKPDGIHLRITAKTGNRDEGARLISGLEAQVRERLGNAVYGVDDDTPWSVGARLLESRKLGIAFLEVDPHAAGTMSALVATLGSEHSKGCISVGRLGDLDAFLGPPERDPDSIPRALARLRSRANADLALGVQITVEESADSREDAVTASAVIFVSGPGQAGGEASHTWKTAPGELKRLAGLAACNMLRLQLLEVEGAGQ